MSNSWRCDSLWDSVDFTPCARDRYIANIPLALVVISALWVLPYFVIKFYRRHSPSYKLTASSLVSPVYDSNLARLEANVLVSSLATSILSPSSKTLRSSIGHSNGNRNGSEGEVEAEELGGKGAETVPPKEGEKMLAEFKADIPAPIARWHKLKYWARFLGAIALLGMTILQVIVQHKWKEVIFPAWLVLLSIIPGTPVTTLLTVHLIPVVLEFRSNVIQPQISLLSLAPAIVELVYWSVLISIPYSEEMNGVFRGGLSHGGGSMGSFGHKLPNHIEEPTSAFARATYTFILPLLYKHFRSPIEVDEIPALREDDGAAASTAGYRAHVTRRDIAYAKRHNGARRQRNLALELFTFFLPIIVKECGWMTVFIILQYLPPTGLQLLLKFIAKREIDPSMPVHVGALYVAMMAIGQSMSALALGQALVLGRRVGIRLRAIIITEVFAKALRRQNVVGRVQTTAGKNGEADAIGQSDGGATDGKIANIVSTDSFQISEISAYIFYLYSSPVAIIVNSFLLYNTLGVASFAGIAVLVALIPLQASFGRFYTIFTRRLLAATDARLDFATEMISHIKLIKFNAWEDKFFQRMGETRRKELKALSNRFGLLTCGNTLIWATPVLVTAVAFSVHVLVLKEKLTADKAFSSLVLFNMLRDPMGLAMDTVTRLLQAYASCKRIQEFLDEPDTLKYEQLSVPSHSDPQIGFRDALFGYSHVDDKVKEDEAEQFRLGELNLSFPIGKLSLVIGPVGSGKTTLITSLLGETLLLSGKVFMPDDRASRDLCPFDANGLRDTSAYCAQTPWLIGASIKDNITFGTPWDAKRYDAVVDACALRRDFEIFDLGDETEVGEKGTTCSGGQKARIALARAVYSSAKTLILDDVLSAVDAQTARHLCDNILRGPLLKGRTCILVTHAVPLVAPVADYIVSLDGGKVIASGTPAELVASGVLEAFPPPEKAVKELEAAQDPSAISCADASMCGQAGETTTINLAAHDIIEDVLDGDDTKALEAKKKADADAATSAKTKILDKKLTTTESQSSGAMSPKTYFLYFDAMGGLPFWFLLMIAFIGTQALQIGNNAWIKDWANSNNKDEAETALSLVVFMQRRLVEESKKLSTEFYLGVYCLLATAYTAGLAFRVGFSFVGSLHASEKLYSKLLRRILGAKMRFFDSTPSGRIMNRLSKDMTSIDTEATEILVYLTNTILSCLAVLVVVIFTTPGFVFSLAVIIFLYWFVGGLYIMTSREIKRHDSVTRSPIFISFSEVLVGMSTIRSYGDSARFMTKLMNEVDQNTRCFWYLWQTNRVLNNLSNFIGMFVTVSASVFALRSKGLSAGLVGMSITYALSFTEFVLWVVRLYAAAEMSMNSVERVAEYLELEVEEEEHLKGIEPPAYWPSRDGSVVVENLTCKYAPQLDPVLRDVSFTIQPREKIGICGRTGSGKSTLALSFFRFLHQEGGRIVIDGMDIGKLSLKTLRSRLTILPQEAQLFSGTIRDNLDPFGQHEDFEIWEALRQCGLSGKTPSTSRAVSRAVSRAPSAKDLHGLKSFNSTAVKGENHKDGDGQEEEQEEEGVSEERVTIRTLDEKVDVGGKNFSQGQRQLLALARGLLKLRTSSFLIMDESTANLDHVTDATIQNVLRTGLPDTQMLVIAHRLMTVCGLDKILVLDHGRVIEFGTPWELMQDEKGSFRDLCRQSGEEAQLFELAKRVHDKKQSTSASSSQSVPSFN